MTDQEPSTTDVTPLQEAMEYVRLAWEIVARDAEAGVLDDADVDNFQARAVIAEAVAHEQLYQTSPLTHGDPLAGLTAGDIQEAYHRLPFAAADVHALPWDDLIARLRSVAQRATLGACVAYDHVTSARMRDESGIDPMMLDDVQAALNALRDRCRAPMTDAARVQHAEAEQALAAITCMRHRVADVRPESRSESADDE